MVVSIIFENKCDSFLKSMEFNVLDSLNSKLQRPEGSGPHDGLTVPFQLPPGQSLPAKCAPFNGQVGSLNNTDIQCKDFCFPVCHCVYCVLKQLLTNQSFFSGVSNEARFVFTVQSIVMPQKLKGTLTFIVKVSKEKEKRNRHAYPQSVCQT